MTTIKRNIVANYIGKLWGFVSVFIFVPFYLKIFGVEAYAIIQFYTVILGIMTFADAGLSITLNREFARLDKNDDYRTDILRTFEYIYIIICVIIIAIICFFSPLIASKWLNVEHLNINDVIYYVRLIGIGVALQLLSCLYQGGLMGLQKQELQNILYIGWSICRLGIVILPLHFYPSLKLYFWWQIIINLSYIVLLKKVVKKNIKMKNKAKFSKIILLSTWKYSIGIMGTAIMSAIVIQGDKLIVSKILPLAEFGYYSLASTSGQMPLLLTAPIAVAIFPQLTKLISDNKVIEVERLFSIYSFIITSIAAIVTIVLFLYMQDYVRIWTHDSYIAEMVFKPARILCMGAFFQATQLTVYYIALANKHTKTNLFLGIGSVVFMIPALVYVVNFWGIFGAAFPWLLMSFGTFIILGFSITKKYITIKFIKWLFYDVCLPSLACIIISIVLFFIFNNIYQSCLSILYGTVIGLICLVCCGFILFRLYPDIKLK